MKACLDKTITFGGTSKGAKKASNLLFSELFILSSKHPLNRHPEGCVMFLFITSKNSLKEDQKKCLKRNTKQKLEHPYKMDSVYISWTLHV